MTGRAVYPRRADLAHKLFYRCEPCDAHVGVHPGTHDPLGRLADAKLRRAKQRVHAAFDPFWMHEPGRRVDVRQAAYVRLAAALGISVEECHAGHFDLARCNAALAVIESWRDA